MGREVHQDKGGLFIGGRQGSRVGQRLPSPHVVLDLAVVEGHDESLDEEDVIPHGGVMIRQVV